VATTATIAPGGRYVTRIPGGRMVEWGILAVLVLALVGVFGHYVRVIQGQGERAAVLSTLGALRTALVIDHVQRHAKTTIGDQTTAPLNPFLVLQALPANYGGEMSVVQSLAAPGGRWVYDPQCSCIGYVPLDAVWRTSGSAASVLWFKVSDGNGPRALVAMEAYVWQGLPVQ
jgi:hypothetical protein